jgi:SRSO17 transposase
MLQRAFEAEVPAGWVLADSFYGRSHAFRAWLEERGRPYAVMVPKTNAVPLGGRKKRIERYIERLPKDAFSEVRPAGESGARRPWEWACVELASDEEKGMRRWLLVRRSTDDPEDLGFYQAYGPEGTQIEELVGVCQERWVVEECFAEAKGEVGLETTTRLGGGTNGIGASPCACSPTPSWSSFASVPPPTVPEARKLILALAAPKRRR